MNEFKEFFAILSLLFSISASATHYECDHAYPVDNIEFNDLVCQANSFTREKKYGQAIRSLEDALKVPTHEILYFEVFANLAKLYYLNEQKEKYLEYLEKYKISLAVFSGIAQCQFKNNEFLITNNLDKPIISKNIQQVIHAMCGGEVSLYLERNDLDRLDIEAGYYKLYLDLQLLQSDY